MIALRHLLRELMRAEAQRSPYPWAAAACGHCWLGVGLWGMTAILLDRWTAVYIAPLLYLALVEGGQLRLAPRITRSLLWDAALDTVAVTMGCIAAACLADGHIHLAAWAWSASLVVAAVGWRVRDA